MKLDILNSSEKLEVSDRVFNYEYNPDLLHQVVVAALNSTRAGTQRQKTRSEVRGGGKKPWRQKGTGRARAGSIRSPLWRGGGVIFAARPRDYTQKVNKKMYRGAMCVIFAELLRTERLSIVDQVDLAVPKTKLLKDFLKNLAFEQGLILVEQFHRDLHLAARNLPHVETALVEEIEPVQLISAARILVTSTALKKIEAWLS